MTQFYNLLDAVPRQQRIDYKINTEITNDRNIQRLNRYNNNSNAPKQNNENENKNENENENNEYKVSVTTIPTSTKVMFS